MAHINTGPGHHDHSVSFFLIRTDLGEPRVVLHLHKKVGRLMMFGGHIELDENPWQAALHEITEETGYNHEQLTVLQPHRRIMHFTNSVTHPVPMFYTTKEYPGTPEKHFHTDLTYAIIASGEPELPLADDESDEMHMFTLSELIDNTQSDIIPSYSEMAIEILSFYYEEWEPVALTSFDIVQY